MDGTREDPKTQAEPALPPTRAEWYTYGPVTPEITETEYAKAFSPNLKRSVWLLVKSVVRHPLLFARTFRRHPDLADLFEEFAPRVSFGRSDHPLDAQSANALASRLRARLRG